MSIRINETQDIQIYSSDTDVAIRNVGLSKGKFSVLAEASPAAQIINYKSFVKLNTQLPQTVKLSTGIGKVNCKQPSPQ